jgi:hypothetical protein
MSKPLLTNPTKISKAITKLKLGNGPGTYSVLSRLMAEMNS